MGIYYFLGDYKNKSIIEINPNENLKNRINDLYNNYSFNINKKRKNKTDYNIFKNSLNKKIGKIELDNKTNKLRITKASIHELRTFRFLENPNIERIVKFKKRKNGLDGI